MEKEIAKNIVKELNVYSKTKFNSLGFNESALQWACGTYKENVSKFLIKFSFDFKKIMYILLEKINCFLLFVQMQDFLQMNQCLKKKIKYNLQIF